MKKQRTSSTLLFAAAALLLHAAVARGQDWTITGLGIQGQTQDLAADASGGVHILWADRSAAYYGMIEESSIAFSETIPDSGDVTIRFTRPRIAVSADGSGVHTAWVTPDPTSDTMMHAWRDEGGAWSTEVVWTRAGTEHLAQPSICVLQDGSVHIIAQRWTEGVDPSPIVYYAKPAGGPWEAPVELCPADEGEQRDTAMVADAGGGLLGGGACHPGPRHHSGGTDRRGRRAGQQNSRGRRAKRRVSTERHFVARVSAHTFLIPTQTASVSTHIRRRHCASGNGLFWP